MNLPEQPSHLTPVQAMRWRQAARILNETALTDINRLDDAGRILTVGRLRGALEDALRLVAEAHSPPAANT